MVWLSRLTLVSAVAALCLACGVPSSHIVHVAPAQFRGTMSIASPESGRHGSLNTHSKRSPAGLVEESLHARGIRFGTDGTVPTLFAYLQGQFARIPAEEARDGDVVFFDTGSGCGGHVGMVETAEASGRIGFREWRSGSSRHSFATPRAPLVRRDELGKILNTFLRPKRMDDPEDTRYFAGEMLCAAFRVEAR
jgi:hypothetical protein